MAQYHIERLGRQGDGIAEGPVFVPLALPGETVAGDLEGQTLHNMKVLTPSDQRVKPPCPHFKSCGGCALQHASDPLVAAWKMDVARDALNSHDIETDLRPIHTSPSMSRRRATFSARRTKKGAMAGFHGRGSDVIVEVPSCQLLTASVLAGRDIAAALAMLGASRKSALAVTVTESTHGLDVSVENGKPLDGPLRQQLAHLCETSGLARLTWAGEPIAMRIPPTQSFGEAQVTPPPGAFLQATVEGEHALLRAVKEAVGDAEHVIDLFAGAGTFSLPLAQHAAVHAVEGEGDMLAALEQGWRMAQGLKPVTTQTRDLFRRPLMPDELAKAQAVVLDPPRAGAQAQVAELARSDVMRLAYVSCNPGTFARDAAHLVAAGFQLRWVQVVDQFRWSTHVELASLFLRPT